MLYELNEELERRIIAGLDWEWEQLVSYYLSTDDYVEMSKPTFELKKMHSIGEWDPVYNKITLNYDFVMNHKWEDVLDVLRHETAHQYVSTLFPEVAIYEKPHGPTFHKACKLLRANPEATSSYETLDDNDGELVSKDKIMSKINKLFALAQSDNKHEAEQAMLKAQELIHYYNIDLIKREEEMNYIRAWVGKVKPRLSLIDKELIYFITNHYFVQAISIYTYCVKEGKEGRVFEIFGRKENVEIASYIHNFILRYIDRQWELFAKKHPKKGKRIREKNSFGVGIIKGFAEKIRDAHQSDEAYQEEEYQLVSLAMAGVDKYKRFYYPHITSGRRSSAKLDPTAHSAGVEKGKTLVIHKGVESSGSGTQGLFS